MKFPEPEPILKSFALHGGRPPRSENLEMCLEAVRNKHRLRQEADFRLEQLRRSPEGKKLYDRAMQYRGQGFYFKVEKSGHDFITNGIRLMRPNGEIVYITLADDKVRTEHVFDPMLARFSVFDLSLTGKAATSVTSGPGVIRERKLIQKARELLAQGYKLNDRVSLPLLRSAESAICMYSPQREPLVVVISHQGYAVVMPLWQYRNGEYKTHKEFERYIHYLHLAHVMGKSLIPAEPVVFSKVTLKTLAYN